MVWLVRAGSNSAGWLGEARIDDAACSVLGDFPSVSIIFRVIDYPLAPWAGLYFPIAIKVVMGTHPFPIHGFAECDFVFHVGGFCKNSSVAKFIGWNLLHRDHLVSGGDAGRIKADHFRHLGFRVLPRFEAGGVAGILVDVELEAESFAGGVGMRGGFKNAESSGARFV